MKRKIPAEAGIFFVWIATIIIFSSLSPNFFTLTNASVLLLNGAIIALISLGQTFVLLTGGIDLSTGATVAMTGIIAAQIMKFGAPWWLATIGAVACGFAFGAINGFLVHQFKIPSFIVTFAAMGVATSIPMIITKAVSIPIEDPRFSTIGQGSFFQIPIPVLIVVFFSFIASQILRNLVLGTHIYALGGNALAARLSGINVRKTTILVFAFSGFLAGLAGVIATSRLGVGYPQTGTGNQLFYSIAAAVVGGVSLFGGIGTIRGTMLGVLLISTIGNGLNVVNVSSYWQPLVIGIIILVGVGIDSQRSRKGEASKRKTKNEDLVDNLSTSKEEKRNAK